MAITIISFQATVELHGAHTKRGAKVCKAATVQRQKDLMKPQLILELFMLFWK